MISGYYRPDCTSHIEFLGSPLNSHNETLSLSHLERVSVSCKQITQTMALVVPKGPYSVKCIIPSLRECFQVFGGSQVSVMYTSKLCQQCLLQILTQDSKIENKSFPSPSSGWVLKFLEFPFLRSQEKHLTLRSQFGLFFPKSRSLGLGLEFSQFIWMVI